MPSFKFIYTLLLACLVLPSAAQTRKTLHRLASHALWYPRGNELTGHRV